jgi:hypothetical protein
MMYFLIYLSRSSRDLSEADLLELLRSSRENNLKTGMTGLLLHKDGNFLQLLEGEKEAVTALFAKISDDDRHFNVTKLLEGPCEARQFPGWSMGFQNLRSIAAGDVPGFSEFLDVPLTAESFADNPSRGQQILLLFRKIG